MKIVAVNGRRASDELVRQAIKDGKGKGPAIEIVIDNSGFIRTVKIDYHDGERYPHLVRQQGSPGLLDDILAPMTRHETRASVR